MLSVFCLNTTGTVWPQKRVSYADIAARDKTNLDIFWLKEKSLADLDNLPDPDLLAVEIIENIESVLAGFKDLMTTIKYREN